MNAKSVGALIAKLRKKQGLTQLDLAQKLNVSDKTISRWESGAGFPEVIQFPMLADIFGVTVDYLMTGQRKGIAVAGNILVDIVKSIDTYPEKGMLVNINDISMAVGGCVPNTSINLAKIDRSIPITVLGKIGDDEYGSYLLSRISQYGIDCGKITVSPNKPTSFTDVMSEPGGERTFFHVKGANCDFSPADIDIKALNCVILHIGYIFLLDTFDSEDSEYGTVMARFLHDTQQAGIKTSLDMVSDSSYDYKQKVLPALKYCNYLIVNEIESGMISGLSPYRSDGKLDTANIEKTARFISESGVSDKVIIHCKDAGFCYDTKSAAFTSVPSLAIPSDEIKGSVGAGDAFCAATLYSIYNNSDDRHMLEFASSAAACNLFASNSVDGMRSKSEIEKIQEKYGRKKL